MYVKVFTDILQSSLWTEDSDTRIVWITILALANNEGTVRATAPGIASQARVSLDITRRALALFEAPDPDSRTPDYEGRRIERINGGYQVLNYMLYRDLASEMMRKDQERQASKRYRERHGASSSRHQASSSRHQKSSYTDTDTDTDTDISTEKTQCLSTSGQVDLPMETENGLTPLSFQATWNEYATTYGWRRCGEMTDKRKRALKARANNATWRDGWRSALETIKSYPFCRGENKRGWIADIDWFMRPDTLTRISEGRYAPAGMKDGVYYDPKLDNVGF